MTIKFMVFFVDWGEEFVYQRVRNCLNKQRSRFSCSFS